MKRLAITSLVLGLVGLLLSYEDIMIILLFLASGNPIVKISICLLAIIFGVLPVIKKIRRVVAITGLVLGVAGIVIVTMNWVDETKVKGEGIFQVGREWTYKATFLNTKENTVDSQIVSLKVPGGQFFGQTKIEWAYNKTRTKAITGVVEDKNHVWIHPPRQEDFRFTELAPFPEVHKPFEEGEKWEGSLKTGAGWEEWEGLTVKHYYQAIAQKDISTPMSNLTGCWQIDAKSESKIGVFGLTFYFHPQHGFVRWEYTKPDSEQVILGLTKVSGYEKR